MADTSKAEPTMPLEGDAPFMQTQSQSAARSMEHLERRLFVGGPVAVFRWIAVAGWPVEYVSPNVSGIFGHAAADFMSGKVPYASVVFNEDLERVAREVAAFSAAGVRYFEQDYRIVRADGEVRWLYDFTVIVRNDRNEITHYEGYVLDITERRRAEADRRELEERVHQAQKLESLGILAGGIAHDFNNLLVGVMGNAALALKEVGDGSALQEALLRIHTSAQRAAELARQMLAYAGRAAVQSELVDVALLLRETLELLRVSMAPGAVVGCEIDADLPRITADPVQVRQVLMNLLSNASDALADATGAINARISVVEVSREELSAFQLGRDREPGRYLAIDVSDTGCGMSPETVARMFDPFFTTKFVGRGLGLASVLGIVRQHRGAIRVQSRVGSGTTIRVLLPCANPAGEACGCDVPIGTGAGQVPPGLRVLVVDDEPMVRDVVVRFAQSLGCRVASATDGAEALALVRAAPDAIDCVVLDATMPGQSGGETLAAIRAIRANMPAVMMSGFVDSTTVASASSGVGGGGSSAFLQKPFTPDELRGKLAEALVDTRRTAISSDR